MQKLTFDLGKAVSATRMFKYNSTNLYKKCKAVT